MKRLEKIRKPFKSSFRVCTPLQFLENNWCGLPWIWHNCNWLISGTRPGRFSVWTLVHTKFTMSEIIFGFALKNTKKVTCWEFKEIRWLKIKTKFVAPFNLRALLHVVLTRRSCRMSHTYLQMSTGYKAWTSHVTQNPSNMGQMLTAISKNAYKMIFVLTKKLPALLSWILILYVVHTCWFTHYTLVQSGDKCGVLSNEADAYKQRKCLLWLWCWWWDLYLKLFFKVKLKFLSKLLLIPKIYLLILLLPSVECRNYKLFVEFMLGKRVYYNILWGLYNITVLSL